MTHPLDRNDLAFWFPLIKAGGLPVPETIIVRTDCDPPSLLDGVKPEGYDDFIAELESAAQTIGYPCFLRTGHTSGKHDWSDTCYLEEPAKIGWHVTALIEASLLADMFGLPTQTWVVRKLIETAPLFRCEWWSGFPVTREFRVFIRDDEVEMVYPYWPADAVADGSPDNKNWRSLLHAASIMTDQDAERIGFLSGMASGSVGGGYWSMDFLQDVHGEWWLTDMADGDRSYRPEAEEK